VKLALGSQSTGAFCSLCLFLISPFPSSVILLFDKRPAWLWQPLAAVAHGHCRPETMELIDACRRTIASPAGAQGSGMGGSRWVAVGWDETHHRHSWLMTTRYSHLSILR
jgi:hypothetical protein